MTLPISDDTLITFLVNAKRQTYAAQGDEATVTPLVPGSRQLEYRDRSLFYRDIYFGEAYFVGQETVYHDSLAVWAMSYAGGFISPAVNSLEMKQVYTFLRAALRQVASQRPYRGPAIFRDDAYVYTDESQGDIHRFSGVEAITYEDKSVYQLRYSGGLLR